MKLFTKEIDKKLFEQYSKGSNLESQKVVAKIFNPYGRGVWYLLNSDPNDPDYIWAIVNLFEVEMGSVSRSELESLRVPPFRLPLERDLYFTPVNAKELYDGLLQGKHYATGGTMDSAMSNDPMIGGTMASSMAKGGGFDQYGNPYGFDDEMDSVYEYHHKIEDKVNPYKVWDKIDGIYVAEFPNRQRAVEWIESKRYAKGGNIKEIPENQEYRYQGVSYLEKDIADKIRGQLSGLTFAGNFYIKGFSNDGFLYFLDEYDMNYVKSQGIKLKPNERLFRYFTRNTAIAGMIPLLKINIESGLIYFSKPTDFGDETLEFETKGLKADYINLVKPAMYGEGGNVADIVSKQLINLQSALDEKNYEKFEYISNEIHEISDSDGLTENEYERWDDLRTKMNEYLLDKFIHSSQYAKGGGVEDEDSFRYRDFYHSQGGIKFETEEEAINWIKSEKPFVKKQLKEGKLVLVDMGGKFFIAEKIPISSQYAKGGNAIFMKGGVMGDIYSVEDTEQFKQIITVYNELSEKFGVVNYFIDHNDNSVIFLMESHKNNKTMDLNRYVNSLQQRGFDVFDKTQDISIKKDNGENEKYYFKLNLSKTVEYGKGGGVGEPYDSMTKYQLEKTLQKLTDEWFEIRKSYNTTEHPRQSEIDNEKDKIITLLYGKNFSGIGQKYKYAQGGGISRAQKRYNKEVDAYKWFIVDLANKRAVSGWEYQSDAKDALSDYDGDENFKIVAERTLASMGIENPKETFKMMKKGGNIKPSFKPDVEVLKDKDGNNYLISSEKMDNAEAVLLKRGGNAIIGQTDYISRRNINSIIIGGKQYSNEDIIDGVYLKKSAKPSETERVKRQVEAVSKSTKPVKTKAPKAKTTNGSGALGDIVSEMTRQSEADYNAFNSKYGVTVEQMAAKLKSYDKKAKDNGNALAAYESITGKEVENPSEFNLLLVSGLSYADQKLSKVNALSIDVAEDYLIENGKIPIKAKPQQLKPSTKSGYESLAKMVNDDDLRPAIQSIYFDDGNLVATDAMKFIIIQRTENESEIKQIVRKNTEKEVNKFAGGKEAENIVNKYLKEIFDGGLSGKGIVYEQGRKLNSNFPNYKAVVPKIELSTAPVGISELISIFNGALLAMGNVSESVKFVPFNFVGKETQKISFNPKLMLDLLVCLQANGANNVILCPTVPTRAMSIFTDNGNFGLIMPILKTTSGYSNQAVETQPIELAVKESNYKDIPAEYTKFNKDIMFEKGGMTMAQRKKVETVMDEYGQGKLNIGKSDKVVTDRKQAVAIALSEAGVSKAKSGWKHKRK
jgi:hypothetical protein